MRHRSGWFKFEACGMWANKQVVSVLPMQAAKWSAKPAAPLARPPAHLLQAP